MSNYGTRDSQYPSVHSIYVRPYVVNTRRTFKNNIAGPSSGKPTTLEHSESRASKELTSSKKTNGCCNFTCYSRVSRALVTTVCICLFMYLAVIFCAMYTQYPTTVDVRVKFPDKPQLPAITICSINLYRKSKMRSLKPELFPDIENPFNTTNIINQFTTSQTSLLLFNVSHQAPNFFRECKFISETSPRSFNDCKDPTWFFLLGKPCFVLNLAWQSLRIFQSKKNDTVFEITLDLECGEYLDSKDKCAADVFLHSPFEIPDIRTSHFTAKEGRTYQASIMKTTVVLLEPPYETMCKNYTKDYLTRHPEQVKIKPSTTKKRLSEDGDAMGETVCEILCRMKAALQKHGCVPNCLPFSPLIRKCTTPIQDQKKKCAALKYEREKCFVDCPIGCEVELYDVLIDEEIGVSTTNEEDSSDTTTVTTKSKSEGNISRISINLQVIRHSFYVNNPKITAIELLGYIGGYLGIFLGISIPMLYDTGLFLVSYVKEFSKRIGHPIRHRLQIDS